MSERVLEFTTRLTREDVAGVIEALVEGLKDGHLKIHKSDEALELDVPRVIDLEVEAKVSEERAKFEIEVSWRTNRAENPDLTEEYASGGADPVFSGSGAPKSGKPVSSAGKVSKKAKSTVKKVAKPAAGAAKKTAKTTAAKSAPRKTKKTAASGDAQ